MRTLIFNVTGQKLEKDPKCDFKDISPGSKGYLTAHFTFDSEWNGLFKAAEFRTKNDGKAYPVLIVDGSCEVPAEVTVGNMWTVSVVGKKGTLRIPTNKVVVRQEG